MRKSRFSDEQIVAILREADRTSVAEAAKKHKVSEQTLYVWRKHFAGLAPADVKRLKALELENAKLKRLLDDAQQGQHGVVRRLRPRLERLDDCSDRRLPPVPKHAHQPQLAVGHSERSWAGHQLIT
jgi:putative transposase